VPLFWVKNSRESGESFTQNTKARKLVG